MSPHLADTIERAAPGAAASAEAEREARRIALISDVHGNLPAFGAVLDDVRRASVEAIWCLGDLVGYGAQPDECVALARESCELCLVGNHDLLVIGRLDVGAFSPGAATAARWTWEHISTETARYLEQLAPQHSGRAIGLYHASPRDPVWEYVLSPVLADSCIEAMDERVSAVGHTHVALFFERRDATPTRGEHAPAGTAVDLSTGDWLINPGAVGQPRDGDPRAAWLLLDLESWSAEWRRVPYEIDAAARAIRDAGLPSQLADRLYYGQ